jgi:hypothetical protein
MIRSNYSEADFLTAADGICPGPDLEWFGIDGDGHLAGFTNAGFAVVPASVFSSFSLFNRTLDVVCSLPRSGRAEWIAVKPRRFDTWDDWSAHGLFAYDWNHGTGAPTLPYRQMCRPIVPIHVSQLPADVVDYIALVTFAPLRFCELIEISVNA